LAPDGLWPQKRWLPVRRVLPVFAVFSKRQWGGIMMLKDLLSGNDAICLLELINKAVYCNSSEELEKLVFGVSDLIAFDAAFCGVAKTDRMGNLKSYDFANVNYPQEWLDLYFAKGYVQVDPVLKENFANFSCQYWDNTYKKSSPPREFISDAEDFGLKSGYTHGTKSNSGREGSLFSFAGPKIENHPRTEAIVEYIIPHFHQALVRVFSKSKGKNAATLTPREREVLRWVGEGKSSWDISVIFGISARTVNYHINNVKKKLDAVNRAQAVAIGVEEGLIDH
jgi:DNA-binding CsgD family transcriptional regulator